MKVHLASILDEYTGGRRTVEGEGRSLDEVLSGLEERYPGLRFRIVDEQNAIRPHIRLFVGRVVVETLDAGVGRGDEVHIIAALSGG